MELKKYLKEQYPNHEDVDIERFLIENKEVLENYVDTLFQEHTDSTKDISVDEQKATAECDVENLKIADVKDDTYQDINHTEDTTSMTQKDVFKPTDISTSANDTALQFEINNKHIVLPNAKVGQAYSFIFDVEKLQLSDIGEYWITGLDDLGLSFNQQDGKSIIEGTPVKSGDYKVLLNCKRKDWQEGKPIFERSITLIINPDPRSLWNNIPTPLEIEHYKPDYDSAFVKVISTKEGGFLGLGKKEVAQKDIVVASQRGRSHAHEGKARDDDFNVIYDVTSQWYIMSVADGAGSAKYSRRGSQIACNKVVEVCKEKISEQPELYKHIAEFNKDKSDEHRKKIGDDLYNIIGVAAFQAHKEIEKEAVRDSNPIKDYSTTLILSICKKFEFGWFIAAFWVGDGGIGIFDKERAFLKILGEPDGGEFAGQTRFLTMKEIIQPAEIYRRLRFDIIENFTALILMTDGVTDPKFETDANLNRIEKWDQLWKDLSNEVDFSDDNAVSSQQLLKWLDFWSPGNHDDRTIAILF